MISTNGFMSGVLTLKCEDTLSIGEVVKLSGNNTVSSCNTNDGFCGVVSHVQGNICAVQLHGTVTVPYSGTAPSVGYTSLSSDGKKGVSIGDGREYLVLSVNETASTVTFIL